MAKTFPISINYKTLTKKYARRFVKINNLKPPVDIAFLAKKYASVIILSFPEEVEGITCYVAKDQKYKMFINNNRPANRIRFTIAHELAHIILPWHIGDTIDIDTEYLIDDDLQIQANIFASEILIPFDWINAKIINNQENIDIKKITAEVIDEAAVSLSTATFKINDLLNPGYIFAIINEDKIVEYSGRSKHTLVHPPKKGMHIDDPYSIIPYASKIIEFTINGYNVIWWNVNIKCDSFKDNSGKTWRELLDNIVGNKFGKDSDKIKRQINGKIAYANGTVKGERRTFDNIYSACIQMIQSEKGKFNFLIQNELFLEFIKLKIESLLYK